MQVGFTKNVLENGLERVSFAEGKNDTNQKNLITNPEASRKTSTSRWMRCLPDEKSFIIQFGDVTKPGPHLLSHLLHPWTSGSLDWEACECPWQLRKEFQVWGMENYPTRTETNIGGRGWVSVVSASVDSLVFIGWTCHEKSCGWCVMILYRSRSWLEFLRPRHQWLMAAAESFGTTSIRHLVEQRVGKNHMIRDSHDLVTKLLPFFCKTPAIPN